MEIKPDDLAYWFFRLNGFLTITNFVVHAERKGITGTDADILGVRFPYRAELLDRPMRDYKVFTEITSRSYIAIAEVKYGLCDLNGPWIDSDKMNIQRVLRAIGAIPLEDVDSVADNLYRQGYYKSPSYYLSLICVGETKNDDIQSKYPLIPQISWGEIKSFIYERFHNYKNVKSWHQHWDENGCNLWNSFKGSKDKPDFVKNIELIG